MFRLSSKNITRTLGRRFNSSLDAAAFKADPAKGAAFTKNLDDVAAHSAHGSATWKKISLVVAVPSIILSAAGVWGVEKKHAEHRKHLHAIPDDEWPKDYPYQNVRSKDFFWGDGDKTLFWNQGVNRHIRD